VSNQRNKPRGIFCLEGDWVRDLNRPTTVKPILDVIKAHTSRSFKYVHLNVHTVDDLEARLNTWTQRRYDAQSVLYLAFHGGVRSLWLKKKNGRNVEISIDDIGEILRGKCEGRMIHFASCMTLEGDERHFQRFLSTTGARAVSGYQSAVAWVTSAAFELLLLTHWHHRRLTPHGVKLLRNDLRPEGRKLWNELRFRLITRH
jgi:hypothetical protein